MLRLKWSFSSSGDPQSPVVSRQQQQPLWSPAAAAHLPQGSTCVRSEMVFSIPSYHLEPVSPFSSDLSHQRGIFTGCFLFFGPFSVNPEMVVGEDRSRSAVPDILRPARLAPTASSKPLKSFPF